MNNPNPIIFIAIKVLGLVAYSVVERWLGRTKKFNANSLLDLIPEVIKKLISKKNP